MSFTSCRRGEFFGSGCGVCHDVIETAFEKARREARRTKKFAEQQRRGQPRNGTSCRVTCHPPARLLIPHVAPPHIPALANYATRSLSSTSFLQRPHSHQTPRTAVWNLSKNPNTSHWTTIIEPCQRSHLLPSHQRSDRKSSNHFAISKITWNNASDTAVAVFTFSPISMARP